MTQSHPEFVTLARVVKPRGNKGEVAAEILSDFPERLPKLRKVFLSQGDATPREAAVQACWLHNGRAVFQFEGCASIGDAEKLRGALVQVPFAERASLARGQYFVSDLVGCSVFENPAAPAAVSSSPCSMATAPVLLGVVRDVEFTGGPPLLAVETHQGELLIPLAEAICTRIDTRARRIEVILPEGLRELNEPRS